MEQQQLTKPTPIPPKPIICPTNQGRNHQTYQPPHQRPPPNQSQAPPITYPSTSSNQDDALWTILQGQKEFQTTLASGLTGLTSTLQALLARMDPPSNSTPHPPNPSAIPSQPQPNPKGGINAITLRSRTQLKEKKGKDPSPIIITQEEEGVEIEEDEAPQVTVEDEETQPTSEAPKNKRTVEEEIAQPIPFPTVAKKARKRMELDPKMIEMFKKVEVTIPLFDAIHQVSKYAKPLKDLCMNKDRILELENIPLGSSIFALMGALPEKCDDPGPCMVTCTVNGVQFLDCMCDLGACVSIMPLSVYKELKLPPLKRSMARFVLADKSIITVTGVAEDVLVNIEELVFLIDFYVLEMPSSESERAPSILLGRPFLRIYRFKLDAYSGTYSFEIDGRVVSFSLEEAIKHPPENHSLFRSDPIDNIVAEEHLAKLDEKYMIEDTNEDPCQANTLHHPDHPKIQTPSQDQKVELKPLPPHLKYSYLDEAHKLPVIIAKELNPQQKEKLLCILRKNKMAIGWSLADLVGISPQVCEHRIFLEAGARPVRQPQRRLNPTILEVVKKEVTRLLEADIIYPISDSEWVSSVQVVPKKSGVTTIKNESGEPIATRVQNS
ncbi:uncharacterized protein LOC107493698 [Arachis duranensis]|uniref:Uncharacterized protein LOC107493698 n=1 Tax=Arachis duranensis TaxID=130453 RepID=A0A6P4DLE8_ARADU|nr:uncharacterized protein LOC107493698 [Arachis duranensis]